MRMNGLRCRPGGPAFLRVAGGLRPGAAADARARIAHRRGHPGGAHRPGRAQVDGAPGDRLHPARAAGQREVYIREGCWYCHSQYVRPVTGETRRWGPITQAGEYAFDLPHLFSTRRIGPDLSRVGLKYSDAWHLAHFWDPRMLSPDSIMPRFVGAVRRTGSSAWRRRRRRREPDAGAHRGHRALFDFASKARRGPPAPTPNAEGLLYVPERGKYPVIFTPNDEFTGDLVAARGHDRRPGGPDRLPAEARHQPGQVARPLRAAAAGGLRGRACRARRSGSPTARRSTSGAASAATA